MNKRKRKIFAFVDGSKGLDLTGWDNRKNKEKVYLTKMNLEVCRRNIKNSKKFIKNRRPPIKVIDIDHTFFLNILRYT